MASAPKWPIGGLVLLVLLLADESLGSVPSAKEHFVAFEGINIHYKVVGSSAETIVFVHGWTCNLRFWDRSLYSFPRHRVIAIDLPGHGISDKPNIRYTTDYFVRSIDAVMKDAGAEQVILIGHSMGARVAHSFYLRHRDKVLGIVLVDGMPWASRKSGPAEIAKVIDTYKKNYYVAIDSTIDKLLRPTLNPELENYVRSEMKKTPPFVGTGVLEAMLREDMEALMPSGRIPSEDLHRYRVRIPALAIFAGEGERRQTWWPDDTEEFLRSVFPDLEFQQWANVSHFLMIERPSDFNQVVNHFVCRVYNRTDVGCSVPRRARGPARREL